MENSHRLCGNVAQTPPSRREASTPTAPAGHLPPRGRQALKSLAQAGFPCASALNLRIPALLRKSETARAKMLPLARCRGKPRAEPTANVGFLFPLTTLSYHSTRKKDFTERFFAKRSGERFKRGVRRSRTARKVCSAATTSVREKSVNPFTAIFSETALCSSFRTRRPLRACPCRRWCRRRRPPRDRGR